ncbi:acyl-CoA thioesterase [Granulicella arctica]|uniref:Acyl-CoA thioester hydrolase n=1 Tax=Granulicella arctica TaxID=940613 RepID=A0A7Y9PIA2_9BACT|nr:thioesterase family protein [Granulicella arctica]NYF79656.1 acyl-CoA thioester hydrolase [Granulicella arctica]
MSDAKVIEARVRVRYAETDQMGVVYHANYLVWFEVGRVEFIRQLGLNYKEMEAEDNCLIAVVEATARYRAPARYDDELVIETRLTASRSSVIRFSYRVVREADGVLLCEGETMHVVVNREMKKTRLPQKYAERFAAYLIE